MKTWLMLMGMLVAGCGSVDKSDTIVEDRCEPGTCNVYCAQEGFAEGICGLQDESCTCVGGGDTDVDSDADSDTDADTDSDADTDVCGFGTDDVNCDGDVDGACLGPEVDNPVAYEGEPGGTVTLFATVTNPTLCNDVVRNFHVYPVGYDDVWWNLGSAPCFETAPPPDYVYTREIGPLLRGCYEIVVVAEDADGNAVMVGSNYADTDTDDTIAMDLLPCSEVPGGCP